MSHVGRNETKAPCVEQLIPLLGRQQERALEASVQRDAGVLVRSRARARGKVSRYKLHEGPRSRSNIGHVAHVGKRFDNLLVGTRPPRGQMLCQIGRCHLRHIFGIHENNN